MGFLADERTLGALELVVCPWPTVETLLAEGVAAATEESRLKVTSRGVFLLAQWAGEHGGRGYFDEIWKMKTKRGKTKLLLLVQI